MPHWLPFAQNTLENEVKLHRGGPALSLSLLPSPPLPSAHHIETDKRCSRQFRTDISKNERSPFRRREINQSIARPINQSINQAVIQLTINQLIKQSTRQPINQPGGRSINQSINKAASQSTRQPINQPGGPPIKYIINTHKVKRRFIQGSGVRER